MSEFPALRQALVAAAARRRRRRLLTGAAVPALAVGAVVVALVSLPHAAPEREVVARPPADALEQAFTVFRRAQRPSDVLPAGKAVPGTIDSKRTRFLAQGGPRRFFAAPSTIQGVPSLCLVAVRRKVAVAAGCGPVSSVVKEDTPLSITVGDVTGVFLPDGSSDLRFIYDEAVGSVSAHSGLSMALSPGAQLAGTSWTGASGTRYIRYSRPVSPPPRPADVCPKRLESLPGDAVARARRAALIAVDQRYPEATEATVTQANVVRIDPKTGDIMDRPCTGSVGERSIEVSLRFVPRSLPDGRLLLGMQDGFMRVYYRVR